MSTARTKLLAWRRVSILRVEFNITPRFCVKLLNHRHRLKLFGTWSMFRHHCGFSRKMDRLRTVLPPAPRRKFLAVLTKLKRASCVWMYCRVLTTRSHEVRCCASIAIKQLNHSGAHLSQRVCARLLSTTCESSRRTQNQF